MILLSPFSQLFAFWRWSQRTGEVKRPTFLLAEAGSRRLYHWLHTKEQRSAAAFLVWTGLLQNSEDQTWKLRSVQLLQRQWLYERWVTGYLSKMSL